jgi:UDP-glucose 4-epimerase
MSKTILVTGGSGYIGSHTIIELLETTDFQVVSVDNYSNSSEATYGRIEKLTNKKIDYFNIDLCDFEKTEALFKSRKIDGIIHFAAFKSVPESVANPHKYYHNNLNSLLNILELSLKYKVEKLIFSSSCSVYGNIEKMPVSEDTPLNKAVSPYAYTKQIGEQILAEYTNVNKQLSVIALRYFNPVGAHMSAQIGEDPINTPSALVPVITRVASGKMELLNVFGSDYATRDGSCIRDYVHVSDVASAHVAALAHLFETSQQKNFDIINIGTGNGVSVFEAITSFEKIAGLKLNYKLAPRREGDVEAIFSDTSKSKEILNWSPKYSLDEMMKSAWEWEVKNN